MKISIELPAPGRSERDVTLTLPRDELDRVWLSVAGARAYNRTGYYLRRHPIKGDPAGIGPDRPWRTVGAPRKVPIAEHLRQLRKADALPPVPQPGEHARGFLTERSILAVPISDLVANLLRPCWRRDGFGDGRRILRFADEPGGPRRYFCLCAARRTVAGNPLQLQDVTFDFERERVVDGNQRDLSARFAWCAAVVPLVVGGRACSAVAIAQADYDLRHTLGSGEKAAMEFAYAGWFAEWERRVAQIVTAHRRRKRPFAVYYHSVIAINRRGDITIRQLEGTLVEIARRLQREGAVGAGLLDSGGSCAIYDGWLRGYLSHSWYFREPRGAVLVFQLRSRQRIPSAQNSWFKHKINKTQ
jgi:hypothetical protein